MTIASTAMAATATAAMRSLRLRETREESLGKSLGGSTIA